CARARPQHRVMKHPRSTLIGFRQNHGVIYVLVIMELFPVSVEACKIDPQRPCRATARLQSWESAIEKSWTPSAGSFGYRSGRKCTTLWSSMYPKPGWGLHGRAILMISLPALKLLG